jgi:hypothetical protein
LRKIYPETVGPQPLRRFITPLPGFFNQAFFEKVCVAPVDHADHAKIGVFAQAFFEKACDQAVFEMVCTKVIKHF